MEMEPRARGEETVLAASAASLYAWRNLGGRRAGAEDDGETTETGSGGRARGASPIAVGFGSVLPPLFGEVFARSIGFVASIDPSCRAAARLALASVQWLLAARALR